MNQPNLSRMASALAERGGFAPGNIQRIEQALFPDGLSGANALAILMALELCPVEKSAEWDDFFVRIVADHVIDGLLPAGRLSADNAEWIRDRLSDKGLVASRNAFEALVTIMERAGTDGRQLAAFALDQVWHAVVEGRGPLSGRRKGLETFVTMEQLTAINRIIAAAGSPDRLSQPDAQALFEAPVTELGGTQVPPWREYVRWVAGPSSGAP